MALYMSQFSYTAEAWAALVKNPADRSVGVKTLLEKMGGKLHHLYYSFGDQDGIIISEAPDETTVAAVTLAGIAAGHLKEIKITQLLTVEQAVEAMGKAGAQVYAAPEG